MPQTNVFYEHNRVTSLITVTEEGIFHDGQVPNDVAGSAELDVDIVHEVQLSDREGNLIVLHFDVPKAMDSTRAEVPYEAKARNFSDTGDNEMPSGLFTTDIQSAAAGTRTLLQLPSGAE